LIVGRISDFEAIGDEKMGKWVFEPGHTAAAFCVRHMMVTYVRGHFKNVHGSLTFDPLNPRLSNVEISIDATGIWTGEPERDAHLRSPDFLDVERHPRITFKGGDVALLGPTECILTGDLTVRGVTQKTSLRVKYLGQWETPWWEGGVDKGPKTRAGFMAEATINRHDFCVSWNAPLDRGGVVVGDMVEIVIDAEAILESL
jgi:polyisoprenoid-binding protein YceI